MKTVPQSVTHELCVRFGGNAATLKFLGGGQEWSDGVLFTFTRAETPAPWVLKILAFKSEDEHGLSMARDRVRLVSGFRSAGVRIILPEPDAGGRIFQTVQSDGIIYAGYTYALAPGRPLDKKDRLAHSSAYYRALGDLLGRLHAASQARVETLSPDGRSTEAGAVGGWQDEWRFMRGLCRDDEVRAAWDRLKEWLETLPVDKDSYGFVHNDSHIWNVLLDPESPEARAGKEPELTIIDFDCAGYHWYMTDAANALYSTLMMASGETEAGSVPEEFRQKVFTAFWEGYRRYKDPGKEWLDRLECFLQYHRCLLFMPFQAETDKNPAWRAHWKRVIMEENDRLFGGGHDAREDHGN